MKTSSFAISGTDPRAVSIARYIDYRRNPYRGKRYIALAPSPSLLKAWKNREVTEEEYKKRFCKETLSKITPEKVLKDLGKSAILLCYEPPGKFCHRRQVALWLEDGLGIRVPEIWLIS